MCSKKSSKLEHGITLNLGGKLKGLGIMIATNKHKCIIGIVKGSNDSFSEYDLVLCPHSKASKGDAQQCIQENGIKNKATAAEG